MITPAPLLGWALYSNKPTKNKNKITMEKRITKIHIISRGKNRDVYGNPYYAFRIHVEFNNGEQATLCESMSWGSSSERDCYDEAMNKIKKTLQGVKISKSAVITHDHTRVSRDSQLEHPERWRV